VAVQKSLPRAFYRKAFSIQKLFDLQQLFYIFPFVETLPGVGFLGGERRELRFPVAQNIRLNPEQAADFANPEVEFVRNFRGFGRRLFNHPKTSS